MIINCCFKFSRDNTMYVAWSDPCSHLRFFALHDATTENFCEGYLSSADDYILSRYDIMTESEFQDYILGLPSVDVDVGRLEESVFFDA